jgi:hypothetical protein
MGTERGSEEMVAMAPPKAQEDFARSIKLFSTMWHLFGPKISAFWFFSKTMKPTKKRQESQLT